MIYGASAGAVFIGGEPRRRMESDLPGCTQCGGAVHEYPDMFRCGSCGMPVESTAPLAHGVEVNRGPDDTQRFSHGDGNQKRHSKR